MGAVTVVDTTERRAGHRREDDCTSSDRIEKLESMLFGPDGWLAYQRVVLKSLADTSDKLDELAKVQNGMLTTQATMAAEISSLKGTARSWGGGLGAVLGGIVAVVLNMLGIKL